MKLKLALTVSCISCLLIASSCTPTPKTEVQDDGLVLVSVHGKGLTKRELDAAIPPGLAPADSALAAEAYIKLWIKDELIFDKAKQNLNDKERIDELVENYRQSLTIFTYQEQLLKENLSKQISESELRKYYDDNTDKFKLESNIIKGLFLKVPLTSPQVDDLRKWYRSTSESTLENIEKASVQNAVIYDYFYDRWVNFEDVIQNIPYPIESAEQFLKSTKNIETSDSTYVYLLNIKEVQLEGSIAPFDYAKGRVLDILLNQKRVAFFKKFDDDLYNDAVKNKDIRFNKKPAK